MIATYSAVMLSDIVEINYHVLCQGMAKELNLGLDNGDGNGIAADGQLHVDEIDSSTLICPAVGMLRDIKSGSLSSSPYFLTAVGNTLYFRATDGTNGYELWKSDGTASGTVMVKDIYSGSLSSDPAFLTVVGSTLYFQANDGTNGAELWKSDGTESGTVMVKNIRSGIVGSVPACLTAVGSTLYF